jgi:DNA mismatch repair ATPase MutL
LLARAKQSKKAEQKSRAKQSRAEQSKAEQSRAEQSKAEQSRAEQSRAEQSRAEQSRAKQSRAKQSKAEQSSSGQSSWVGSFVLSHQSAYIQMVAFFILFLLFLAYYSCHAHGEKRSAKPRVKVYKVAIVASNKWGSWVMRGASVEELLRRNGTTSKARFL